MARGDRLSMSSAHRNSLTEVHDLDNEGTETNGSRSASIQAGHAVKFTPDYSRSPAATWVRPLRLVSAGLELDSRATPVLAIDGPIRFFA